MSTQFILYLCPTGPLSEQIALYFRQSKAEVGENLAHAYMPHCTLTGFFFGINLKTQTDTLIQ